MKTKLAALLACIALLAVVVPLQAHHPFSAEYDKNKPITMMGTVTKIDWMNPHIWIYIAAKDDSGKVTQWQCEGGPPNSLTRNGWTKNALKEGDQVTIEGFRAKNATNTCDSRAVKLPDGRKVFSGTADDGGPKAATAPSK